jgi:microcystin-dependent protein
MPYVGEIRMFAGNFAPAGWRFCDGSTLPISENPTLFQLIGTTYGGDGENTFNLPDLRGRVPVHMGTSAAGTFTIGEMAGVEAVTLTTQQIPAHTHALLANGGAATDTHPAGKVLAKAPLPTTFPYGTDAPTTVLHPGSVSPVGGSQPHENMQPFLCINFIISDFGVFPSPT